MVRRSRQMIALCSILLVVMLSFFCSAVPAWGATQHMYNETGYMSDSDMYYVDRYLTQKSAETEFDIVGVLINRGYNESELRAFADDFYDYRGFGYGDKKDGAIFVVDMGSRLMTVVTTGYGTTAITDYGEEAIYDYVTDSLQSGDYAGAYRKYADAVVNYVLLARQGKPVDVDDGGGAPDAETLAGMGGISLAVGAGAGLFSSHAQKSKLKSVKRKTQANSYARRDSLVLTRKQDRFLYSTVAVIPRPKQDNNSNHRRMGGGGTTIHMGSSGVPHGGGHARGF